MVKAPKMPGSVYVLRKKGSVVLRKIFGIYRELQCHYIIISFRLLKPLNKVYVVNLEVVTNY